MNHDCPPLEQLLDDHSARVARTHVRDCDACRALVLAVADGDHDDNGSEACERAELLTAAMSVTELEADDQAALEAHLEDCGRCRAAARSVFLDLDALDALDAAGEPAPERARAVSALPEVAVLPRSRPAWVVPAGIGVALAAAVLIAAMVLGGGDGEQAEAPDQATPTEEPAGARTAPRKQPAPAPPTPPPMRQHPDKRETPTTGVQPADDEAYAETLKRRIDDAGRRGNYAQAYEACDELIRIKRAGLSNVSKCVVYSCRGRSATRAKSYFKRIRSTTTRTALANNCMNYGIKLDPDRD